MARTILNPALRLLKGRIGDFVYRLQPDGSITVSKVSLPRPGRKLSPSQFAQVQRFKYAMALYRSILQDPATRAAYERLYAAGGSRGRLHAIVVGDIMKPPVITLIDLSAYHGSPGDTIRVMAEDNLAVARISLVIYDLTAGCDVETGEDPRAFQRSLPPSNGSTQRAWRSLSGTPSKSASPPSTWPAISARSAGRHKKGNTEKLDRVSWQSEARFRA